MDKNEVRQLIMNRRHELSDEDIEMQSRLIIDRLKKSDMRVDIIFRDLPE